MNRVIQAKETSKIAIAKEVLDLESKAISDLCEHLDHNFSEAVDIILSCKGKVAVLGIGKSGLIGKKIAATLTSTGTPSFFLHPGEALHGDLGTIEKNDCAILLSNSGETDELLKLIPFFKQNSNKLIAITGNTSSILAKNADATICSKVIKEACPLELAPTASTTAMLALGDALAITLMKITGFDERQFAKYHPEGSIGKRLLTEAKDLMRAENLPTAEENISAIEVVDIIAKGKLGICIVMNNDYMIGIITDGDISRAMRAHEKDFFLLKAQDMMTSNPISIRPEEKLAIAAKIMNEKKVNTLLVCKEKSLLGVLQIYDINNLNK